MSNDNRTKRLVAETSYYIDVFEDPEDHTTNFRVWTDFMPPGYFRVLLGDSGLYYTPTSPHTAHELHGFAFLFQHHAKTLLEGVKAFEKKEPTLDDFKNQQVKNVAYRGKVCYLQFHPDVEFPVPTQYRVLLDTDGSWSLVLKDGYENEEKVLHPFTPWEKAIQFFRENPQAVPRYRFCVRKEKGLVNTWTALICEPKPSEVVISNKPLFSSGEEIRGLYRTLGVTKVEEI